MIFAILRAQLQSLLGAGFGRSATAWISVIPTLFFYTLFTFVALGAFALYSLIPDPATLRLALAGGLLAVFLYWQIAPIVTVTGGASLDLQKLIVYPINLDKLFTVEVLLRAMTVGEMLLVLTGIGIGVLNNSSTHGWSTLPRIALAFLIFAVFNMVVAAGVRSSMERFFKGRRTKEIGMLLVVLFCAAPGAIATLHLHYERMVPYLPLQPVYHGALLRIACFPHLSGEQLRPCYVSCFGPHSVITSAASSSIAFCALIHLRDANRSHPDRTSPRGPKSFSACPVGSSPIPSPSWSRKISVHLVAVPVSA